MSKKQFTNNLSVPVKYEVMSFEDDRFKKCKILVMHDGLNLNGSVFKMDAIENAKESIKNIPILAFIKQQDGSDESDFGGHESEVILTNDGIKSRYLGRPIGIIPADANDYHYEIYGDKTYVAVTGYIWTDYANEALDILNNTDEKSQSMEIRVDDGDWDIYNNFNISSYRYTGLTLLGDNVRPAMEGAKCQMFSIEDGKFSDEYFSMVDELSKALKDYASQSEESEVKDVEEKELETVEEVVETEETVEVVEETTETTTEETTETFEETEEVVETEETEEVVEETVEETTEVVVENDFSVQLAEKDGIIFNLNKELSELRTNYDTLEAEVVTLRADNIKYEAEKTREEKEVIFEEFSVGLTSDEMQLVKDEMDNLSIEQIRTKLNEVFTNKNLTQLKNKKTSTTDKYSVRMDLPKKETKIGNSRYAV